MYDLAPLTPEDRDLVLEVCTPRQAQVVIARHGGHSWRYIAAAMERSLTTTVDHYHAGIARVAKVVRERGEDKPDPQTFTEYAMART